MAEKSIKKNFIFNIFYQVLVLLMPLITTPYVSRVLGVDGVGLYSYANSIMSYFLLFAVLGTVSFGQRAIGYTQNNIEDRSRAFWEIFLLRTITSCVTLIAYFVFIFLVVEQGQFVIYLMLALNIFNVICDISWFFQGMEEFGKTVTVSCIFRLLYLAAIFLFVKSPDDLWVYILIMAGQAILGNLSLWALLPRYICKVKKIRPFRDIKSVIQLFIPTIAFQIYLVLDKSMIGWFSDSYTENGYYEQADKMVKLTLSAVTALGTVMSPRISRCFKEGNDELIRYYIYKSYRFIWLMAVPIMIGLIAISNIFVPIFFGQGYEKCAVLIPILSCLTVIIGLSNVTGIQYLIPTGKQNVLTITVLSGAVVNVCLNLILIPISASVGAAIASVVAELCVTVTGLIYLKMKKNFSIWRIVSTSWKYWVAGTVMGGVVFAVKIFLTVSVWALVVLVAVGVAVYFLMLLLLRDAMLMEILSKGLAILKRGGKTEQQPQSETAKEQSEETDFSEETNPSDTE